MLGILWCIPLLTVLFRHILLHILHGFVLILHSLLGVRQLMILWRAAERLSEFVRFQLYKHEKTITCMRFSALLSFIRKRHYCVVFKHLSVSAISGHQIRIHSNGKAKNTTDCSHCTKHGRS